MNIIAVTQARTGSTRLPNKVLKKVGEQTLLEIHLRRILQANKISKLIVATTTQEEDRAIVTEVEKLNLDSYRGSVSDVLDRFYQAVKDENPDWVVRLTSDCPLIDPKLIDDTIQFAVDNNLDYCSNTLDAVYPDGQDVEVFKFSALEKAHKEAKLGSEREHVTPYIWKNSTFKGGKQFSSDSFKDIEENYGHVRMTVDEPSDFEMIQKLIESMGVNRSWLDYAKSIEDNEELKKINQNIERNQGYQKSIKEDK